MLRRFRCVYTFPHLIHRFYWLIRTKSPHPGQRFNNIVNGGLLPDDIIMLLTLCDSIFVPTANVPT